MSQGKRGTGIGTVLAILMVSGVQQAWSANDRTGGGDRPKPDAAARTSRDSAQTAVERGVKWLQTHQRDNGSWSDENYPALTALCLWAATRSGIPSMTGACDKAAAYVAGFAQQDGGIYKPVSGWFRSGGLSTYNTAICMTALHEYNRAKYADIVLKARAYVAGSQLSGDSPGAGGFGYDRAGGSPRNRADLSNTGWALMAMRVTQDVQDKRTNATPAVDVDWAAAVKFIERLQNNDENDQENNGGFGYARGGERGGTTVDKQGVVTLRGYGSMTYAGIEAMIYAQVDRKDPRVRSAVDWASRHWSVDENPGMGLKGLFYYYTVMAKALSIAGGDTLRGGNGQAIAWRQDLTAKLVNLQRPDGSWANTDNTFWERDPALVTAYALLTIEYAL